MSKVYLVGAGPGDPDLITVKGRELLASADSILYDHLASDHLLTYARPDAERLYVGKKKAEHAYTQEEICALLVERGRRGLNVVRLKGGDPFIFGRGGEEAEALADAGVPFEIVPGVTAPLGIAAYTGVPLTHREHTSVVTFVTGHAVDQIDWSKIGLAETLVVFMGLSSIREIAREIVKRGRAPETPTMAVRWGTRPDQHTVTGTLASIADQVEQSGLRPPATIIIGEVVRLRERLDWFEHLPLFGKRVVVTRAREQAPELSMRLRALAAAVIELPVIALEPPRDPGPLNAAIERLEGYDWLIFTSVNGVRFFLESLDRSGRDLRALRGRLCAIGPATRAALERLHLKVDRMPGEYVAEELIRMFTEEEISGKRVLLPRAAVARDVIPDALLRRGASVDVVETYRNAVPPIDWGEWRNPHWVTFTSSSTVRNFVESGGRERLAGVRVASIGPVTSAKARELGVRVDAEAREYTMDGLVQALVEFGG